MKRNKRNKSMIVSMKKLVLLLILVLPLLSPVYALQGVGLNYQTVSADIPEEETTCIAYGVYNPWDEDVTIILTASGEFSDFASNSQSVFVQAETSHREAKEAKICFKVGNIYENDCLFGPIACAQTCPAEMKIFEGDISARADQTAETTGTGSAAIVIASAPLRLKIKCIESDRDWTVIYAMVGIVLAIIGFLIYRKMNEAPPEQKKREEYGRLYQKLMDMRKKI